LADFFASGRIADLILACLALEAVGLWAFRRATGRGPSLTSLAPGLLAGACLVLGLRLAVTGAPWALVGLALSAGFAAHLVDLRARWIQPR
jgi:hypothetical protein